MKKQRNLLITLIIFLALMIGAYVLYTTLAEDYKPDSGLASLGSDSSEDTVNIEGNLPETDETASESGESANESAPDEYPAPDFTVYDYDGNKVSLSDFVGKPVIVNFWASWCGPCQSEMPEFEDAYNRYGDEITFMMVNLTDGSRETVETAHEFISKSGYTFPIYYDKDYDGAVAYSVSGIPATYFIDSNGNLQAYAISALDAETLELGIGMIYKGNE